LPAHDVVEQINRPFQTEFHPPHLAVQLGSLFWWHETMQLQPESSAQLVTCAQQLFLRHFMQFESPFFGWQGSSPPPVPLVAATVVAVVVPELGSPPAPLPPVMEWPLLTVLPPLVVAEPLVATVDPVTESAPPTPAALLVAVAPIEPSSPKS
jgi:hypothetical protein